MTRATRNNRRADGGSTYGSTSASAPSRASTKPARRLRARWTMPPITSDLPARVDGDDAARHGAMGHAPEARLPDHARKGGTGREAADRLDEVAIRLGVPGDDAAQRRDDVEGIGVVERVEPGHVDIRELEAQEVAAAPEHAIRFRQRGFDARHVADAERDRVAVISVVAKRRRLGITFDEVDTA